MKDALYEQIETEQIRIEGLTRFKPEVQSRLQKQRLIRSHLEEQIRDLQSELQDLARWEAAVESDLKSTANDEQRHQEKLESLEYRIDAAERELADMQAEMENKSSLYSIVPTRSKNGTARRPIYVECKANQLILQPLGIELTAADFTLPLLPGNPLDSALLAIRQHWNTFQVGNPDGEPYPLLVVRPSGATTYAIARRAMKSWDDEFGYELVTDDVQLDFGERDPALATVVEQAIDQARRRQAHLVASQSHAISNLSRAISGSGSGHWGSGNGGSGDGGSGDRGSGHFAQSSTLPGPGNHSSGRASNPSSDGPGHPNARSDDVAKKGQDVLSRFRDGGPSDQPPRTMPRAVREYSLPVQIPSRLRRSSRIVSRSFQSDGKWLNRDTTFESAFCDSRKGLGVAYSNPGGHRLSAPNSCHNGSR